MCASEPGRPPVCRLAVAVFVLAILAVGRAHAARDRLTIKDKDTVLEGYFHEYKSNRFYIKQSDGKLAGQMRARVVEVTLDPPARVSFKPFGKPEVKDAAFTGYRDATFHFEVDGRPVALPGSRVTFIKPGMDFNRSGNPPPPGGDDAAQPGAAPKVEDIESLVEFGKVTVIHFHMPSLAPSLKLGNYVASIAEDPVAVKHNIRSLPQFWFYNRRGKLATKVTERFVPNEIDAAIRKAQR
jgi:hypothetical protein